MFSFCVTCFCKSNHVPNTWRTQPSIPSVFDVFAMVAKLQMRRTNAPLIVAGMQYKETFWNRTEMKLKRKAVSLV